MSEVAKKPDVMLKEAYEVLSAEEKLTELAKGQTVEQVYEFIRDNKRNKVSKFVYNRFYRRYLMPSEWVDTNYNSGFAQMAICCLMIEAMESFRNGWEDTNKLKDGDNKKIKGGRIFGDFFKHYGEFADFKDLGDEFYDSIRCGILHQAESRNGWKIVRDKKYPLLDDKKRIIHSTKFRYLMKTSLRKYCKELEENDGTWDLFKTKMAYVIANCHKK
ncbi:MAG: hypothetical protein H6634_13350 [Anaerolineales bacterium]|nr:hypothetical protein [Anaerolineales bacterium]